jgi:glyoxylase-like metal-dependent hydrolase (beta-lactamase superfamily II)
MEVVPGIHRIQSDIGPRIVCQYFFDGPDRKLLVDTGIGPTPEDAIAPYLEGIGSSIEAVDDVIVSHADVDHCGGDHLLKSLNPRARLWCHELDRPWIESNTAMMNENYGWHASFGFPQPEGDDRATMFRDLGGDCPVDFGLRGGETVGLGPDWRVEVMHLPGHSLGHLGIWDARSGAAVIIDAVLERGIYSRAGELLIPPRYYDATAYQNTIRRLISLRPSVLLTAHYEVMKGDKAIKWLEKGLAFTYDLHDTVREALRNGTTDLWELTQYADKKVGPYTDFMTELGASVRSHVNMPGMPVR